MLSIRKEFEIDLAHRLTFHKWKCFNVHGHRYKIIIELTGDLDWNWMLVDFGDLKYIKERLDENWDHSYVYCNKDEVWKYLTEQWYRTFNMKELEPTAENMSMFLYMHFKDIEPRVSKVIVYETPTAYALFPNSVQ